MAVLARQERSRRPVQLSQTDRLERGSVQRRWGTIVIDVVLFSWIVQSIL